MSFKLEFLVFTILILRFSFSGWLPGNQNHSNKTQNMVEGYKSIQNKPRACSGDKTRSNIDPKHIGGTEIDPT